MDAFDRHRHARQGTRELGALFDRLPPHSIEAEMSLLGSMILEPQVIADVISRVHKAEAFYNEAHGAIFQSLIEIYDRYHSGDLVQLVDALREKQQLDLVGGEEYLIRLAEAVPSATNAVHYARIVAEKFKLRRLIAAAGDILYKSYHVQDLGPEGAQEVLDQAESQVFEIASEESTNDPQRLGDLLQIEIDRLETA
ncbi:MAG: hypothetical protein KDA28_09905, partial [Phycisphaerales bacterium]|nr:hypothetical protein [Phycisphaerales bacterium]